VNFSVNFVKTDSVSQPSQTNRSNDAPGNLLFEPRTLQHQAPLIKLAIRQIREAQQEHAIEDMIVVVERTANYYLPVKRAFATAGFDTRVVHLIQLLVSNELRRRTPELYCRFSFVKSEATELSITPYPELMQSREPPPLNSVLKSLLVKGVWYAKYATPAEQI
jgi:hypothetical protein